MPSFYFDLALLEDYWLRRKYHHTMSSTLVYALSEALVVVEEEGLDARWVAPRAQPSRAGSTACQQLGLSLLPPQAERLWTLNAVRVPDGVDEARVRKHLLDEFNIEIGAGLGPLAGKIWRVGLMGASSSPANIARFLTALAAVLDACSAAAASDGGYKFSCASSVGASRSSSPSGSATRSYIYLTLPDVRALRTANPTTTAFMALRAREAAARGEPRGVRSAMGAVRADLAESEARRARHRGQRVLAARRRRSTISCANRSR